MQIVGTIQGKCRRCYACVWNCPVKAIKVEHGQAQIIPERCISCGICVEVCSQKAKRLKSGIAGTQKLLDSGDKVIAIVDATMPASFADCNPGQVAYAIKKLGFTQVLESSFGAALLLEKEYSKYFNGEKPLPVISSECPAAVKFIEKFYPGLIKYLAPLVSSPLATAIWAKKYVDPHAKFVYIGPCAARKSEIQGIIQQALVYQELKQLMTEKGINPKEMPVGLSDNPPPGLARGIPLAGGMLRTLGRTQDVLDKRFLVNQDRYKLASLLSDMQAGRINCSFIELNFCGECLQGPQVDCSSGVFASREKILKYVQTDMETGNYPYEIDLKREFISEAVSLDYPSPEQLKEILQSTNKIKPSDELNCGACGYGTCRELAVAIFQKVAEKEMCHHYLLQKVTEAKELMLRGEKMVSLGQLAASLAHELKNPLFGSLMYLRLLNKKVEANSLDLEELKSHLILVEGEIDRCNKIIINLLDFSRQSKSGFAPVDLNEIIENSLFLVHHQAQIGQVDVEKDFAARLPLILADRTQIEQVFVNLILNAIHAMPSGGKLTLKTTYFPKSREIQASVIDTGCGISRNHLQKLFTPFFTTKKTKGVGLGLAVARGIIESHQGSIEVKSVLGRGSAFTIRLGVISA